MKKLILALTLAFLVSCGMTNQERIEEIKFCEDNGYTYITKVGNIHCRTEEEKKIYYKQPYGTPSLTEVDRIQINNCINLGKQPIRNSWNGEYYCE